MKASVCWSGSSTPWCGNNKWNEWIWHFNKVHAQFWGHMVTVLHLSPSLPCKKSLGISSYPLYHSMYETFFLMSEIMDKSFEYHLAVTRIWAELARDLADSLIIPFNTKDTAKHITESIQTLKGYYETEMAKHSITWGRSLSNSILSV